jgi:hypothetical protein
MAIPFSNPLFNLLPDGGLYTIDGYPINSPSVAPAPKPAPAPAPTPTPAPQTTIDGYDITSPSVAPSTTLPPTPVITPTPTPTPTPTVTSPVVTTNPPPADGVSNRNAREFLLGSLRQYFSRPEDAGFLKDLEKIIDGYLVEEYDEDTISVLLLQSEPYKQRFKGNEERVKAGLSPLSPKDYIDAEAEYNNILKRFNLSGLATRDTFTSLISGQVSAAELTDRVVNVYDRIRNADPALRAEIDRVEKLSRGQLSDADFAKALLTGETGANELKRKISVAEISAEARQRNLSVGRAQELQQLGVTREDARQGFEAISRQLPRTEFLSDIYQQDSQNLQTELEQEQFQGMLSQRRKKALGLETAQFRGSTGLTGTALQSTPTAGQL